MPAKTAPINIVNHLTAVPNRYHTNPVFVMKTTNLGICMEYHR